MYFGLDNIYILKSKFKYGSFKKEVGRAEEEGRGDPGETWRGSQKDDDRT